MVGWVDEVISGRAGLRIAYSNQKLKENAEIWIILSKAFFGKGF